MDALQLMDSAKTQLPPSQRKPHFVYILKNSGQVVYVGCTKDVTRRIMTHKKDKDFDRVSIRRFENKPLALCHERDLIMRLMPKYNKGINAVSSPIEEDIEWLKSEFGV